MKQIQSNALKANLASIDVAIDPKYFVIRDVMSRYYGLMEGVDTFLKELSHPLQNLQFIVSEARNYALNYFHLLKSHPEGHEAAGRYIEIFFYVIKNASNAEVRADAADNLVLFLQKIIKDAGTEDIIRFMPVLDDASDRMIHADDAVFFLFIKSYYRLEKLAEALLYYSSEIRLDFRMINRLLFRYFCQTYEYWLNVEDPLSWFGKEVESLEDQEETGQIFAEITHGHIRSLRERLDEIISEDGDGTDPLSTSLYRLSLLLTLPGYNRIVDSYREVPRKLLRAGQDPRQGNRWKVMFLFHIMNIAGLSLIHEEVLRDINRTLSWLIENETEEYIQMLIQETFAILRTRTREFPATALNCVLNMGKGVYKTDNSDLVKFFINNITDLGFQAPMIGGVGNDWQIRVNSAHILNIRTCLELCKLKPKWSTRLLSDLIIHLSVSGVFIKDTDLFPRDITRLLNSDIGPVYNLVKQLARIFPTYFNDIGAEGSLRDISTRIDEITHRKDQLVHFLRKQVHVESSNRVVGFMEAVFRFWRTRKKFHVDPFVPPSIYKLIDETGPFIEGVHRIMTALEEKKSVKTPADLLKISETDLRACLLEIEDVSATNRERVELAVRLYRQLHHKYNLVMDPDTCGEICAYLSQIRAGEFPGLDHLKNILLETDLYEKLSGLLDYLEKLKNLILSPAQYEIREDIYKKRHFTVDIPSMYGSYHELKFDALGLTFRIESVANVCFEEVVNAIDLTLITRETFHQIRDLLQLFYRGLKIDGMTSVEMESQLELLNHALKTRGFTFTQYLDIFRGFARAVKNIINDYFNNIHKNNLNRILENLPPDRVLEKYLAPDDTNRNDVEKRVHRISEMFLRDKIAASLGLQQLDLLLTRVLNTLFTTQSYRMPDYKLRLLLNYDPQRAMVSIPCPDEKAVSIILLGNKGNNLVKLHRLGLPVPPGFIITTEVFRCWEVIEEYPPAEQNFKKQIRDHIRYLEKQTGKQFGNPDNPLLFSVRSGSSISQPGMMDTFLNVGINEDIAAGMARRTGNQWFAWDNYRRFLQCYGMAFGLQRDEFDTLMREFKRRTGLYYKRLFSGEQMRELALDYKTYIRSRGVEVTRDPFDQLLITLRKVLKSWESPKARTYRKIIGISDDWGTAVTVQCMVYGNLADNSGTGVFFTHNPKWSEENIRLWGDFTVGNQGEDVVSGLVETLPVSVIQMSKEKRNTDVTLERQFSAIHAALKEWANKLIYQEGWNPQEMEFTFESPDPADLYLLQTRNMAIRERKKVMTFDPESMGDDRIPLTGGIGVSGGAMSGRVVFTLEEIDQWRKQEPKTHLILLRGDTVPDDIREINAADGLLTARGGVTSHASVVAHRLGKTCVVGCGNLVCNEREKVGLLGNVLVNSGDYLSIDGQEGLVYQGFIRVSEVR